MTVFPALPVRKTTGLLAFVLISATLSVGCGAKSTQTAELYSPTFEYDPPAEKGSKNIDVTLALVRPSFLEEEEARTVMNPAMVMLFGQSAESARPWHEIEPFASFSRNLSRDFQELLSARGFSTMGPYSHLEEMTYPQKQGSDLALVPQLEITLRSVQVETEGQLLSLIASDNRIKGVEKISGRVTLALIETLSGERMWYKSIEVPDTTIAWQSKYGYSDEQAAALRQMSPMAGMTLAQLNDPGYLNPISKALESYYPTVLQKAWEYLNPQEVQALKRMAEDLKERYRVGR